MQIPLYKERVAPSTQTTAPIDPHSLDAKYDAVADIGAGVERLGKEYWERKNKLKDDADFSDYNVEKTKLETRISAAKQKALLEEGVPYSDIQAKVVNPMVAEFTSQQQTRGYSNRTKGKIAQLWELDAAGIAQEEASWREKMEINDYVQRIDKQAQLLLSSPDADKRAEGNALYDGLSGVIGDAPVAEMKSGALYKLYDVEAAMNVEALRTGSIEPKDYMERTKELRKKIRDNDDLSFDHKKTMDSRLTYQVANVAASQVKKAEQMEIKLSKDVISGDVNQEWKETAVAAYGEEAGEQIEKIIFNSMTKVAATNKDVRKGLEMLEDMRTTPMVYTDVVKHAADNCGKYGEEIRELAAIFAAEHIKDGAALAYTKYVPPATFGPFASGETVEYIAPYTGWVADIHDDIIKASTTTDDMSLIQGYQRKLIDFYYRNPHPEQEDIDKFKISLLGKHWGQEVQTLNTPQLNKSGEVRRMTSDGGYAVFNAETKEFIRYE